MTTSLTLQNSKTKVTQQPGSSAGSESSQGSVNSADSQNSRRDGILLPETGRHLGWNEEHFITVSDFANNAPAVIRLEIARISAVLGRLEIGSDSYNEIVSARHRLTTLVEEIESIRDDVIEKHLFQLLEAAILSVSIEATTIFAGEAEELNYAANRLDYIVKQMRKLA